MEILTREERDRLLRGALRVAARQRAHELAQEGAEALGHVQTCERKYGVGLAEFERDKLAKLDGVEGHVVPS